MMPVKRLSLTDFKVSIPRGAREKTLKLALNKDGVMAKCQKQPGQRSSRRRR